MYQITPSLLEDLAYLLLHHEIKDKPLQVEIKNIFANLVLISKSHAKMVEQFFKDRLSKAMEGFIQTIKQEVINLEKLNKLVVEITQLIKTTQSNKKKEQNICDKEIFFRVVNQVSDLIDSEQSGQSA